MSWQRDYEERTECAYSEECNNVADDYVRSMSKGIQGVSRTQGRVTRMDSRYICGIALCGWLLCG